MRRIRIVLLAVLGCVVVIAAAAEPSLALRFAPHVFVPLGASSEDLSADSLNVGMGIGVQMPLALGANGLIAPALYGSYDFVPLDSGAISAALHMARVGLGPIISIPISTRIQATLRGAAGIVGAFVTGDESSSASGLYARGGGAVTFAIGPNLLVDVWADYMYHHQFYGGLAAGIAGTLRLAGEGGGSVPSVATPSLLPGHDASGYIEFVSVETSQVFPVLFQHYDTHSLGTFSIINAGRREIRDVEVRLVVGDYMDNPLVCAAADSLDVGEELDGEIVALFNERMLTVTEGIRLAARLEVSYVVNDNPGADAETVNLRLFDRNALRWDDDQKAAVFVTARDDEVQRFSRNMAAAIRDSELSAIDSNLQRGMMLFEALRAHGMTYEIDPSSSYAELSQDELAIDYVQFPRQTLQFRAGDCDDLTVTYCALLESLGIPSAFITVPGHIFSAFKLETSATEVRRNFSDWRDIILLSDDSAWVPVEITLLDGSFTEAWHEGAREWQDYESQSLAILYPTQAAWEVYDPVAYNIGTASVTTPDAVVVAESFQEVRDEFVHRQIHSVESSLLAALQRSPNDHRQRNRLAVTYARYGMMDRATEELETILEQTEYAPALINMGNIYFQQRLVRDALVYYERALLADPDSAGAALGAARASHLLQDYDNAEGYFEQLSSIAPQVAAEYDYLSRAEEDGARAQEASDAYSVRWEE